MVEDRKNRFVALGEDEWVEKPSLLIADADLRWKFAKEGRRTVEERYSAKTQVSRLLDVLEQVRRTNCGG